MSRKMLADAFHGLLSDDSMFAKIKLHGNTGWLPRFSVFLAILWPVLHQRMQEVGGRFWQIGGWVPIAFDGSRSSALRTEANEAAFCAKN